MSQMCGIARSCVRGRIMKPEPDLALDAADDDALGRAEELVQLPEQQHGDDADHAPADREPPLGALAALEPGQLRAATAPETSAMSAVASSGGVHGFGSSSLGRHVLGEGGDHGLAVDAHGLLLVVVLEVAGELVTPISFSCLELGDVLVGGAEDAEPVDDLVGHEVDVVVVGLAVRVVVVARCGP